MVRISCHSTRQLFFLHSCECLIWIIHLTAIKKNQQAENQIKNKKQNAASIFQIIRSCCTWRTPSPKRITVLQYHYNYNLGGYGGILPPPVDFPLTTQRR